MGRWVVACVHGGVSVVRVRVHVRVHVCMGGLYGRVWAGAAHLHRTGHM